MKVIKRSKMPNGIGIQIEDWRENYSFIKTLEIACYPKAKNTSKSGWIQANKKFRLKLENFDDDKQVEKIFSQLETGEIKLESLSKHFSDGKKDEYYLGLNKNDNEMDYNY